LPDNFFETHAVKCRILTVAIPLVKRKARDAGNLLDKRDSDGENTIFSWRTAREIT